MSDLSGGSGWKRLTSKVRDLPASVKVGSGVLIVLVVIGVVAAALSGKEPGRSAVTPAANGATSTSVSASPDPTGQAQAPPSSTATDQTPPPSSGDEDSPPPTDAPFVPTTTIPVPAGTWTEVGSLSGTGDQHGEAFPLDGYVRVGYRSAEGSFEVYLVGPGGAGSPVATCPDACDSQVVVTRDRADYFIDVKNPGEWTIIVEELR